jgi:hypothetical protein
VQVRRMVVMAVEGERGGARACSLCRTSRIVVEPHLPTWMKTVTGVSLLLLLVLLLLPPPLPAQALKLLVVLSSRTPLVRLRVVALGGWNTRSVVVVVVVVVSLTSTPRGSGVACGAGTACSATVVGGCCCCCACCSCCCAACCAAFRTAWSKAEPWSCFLPSNRCCRSLPTQ